MNADEEEDRSKINMKDYLDMLNPSEEWKSPKVEIKNIEDVREQLGKYIDGLNLKRHWSPHSISEMRKYLNELWKYKNEMDPGYIILIGLSDEVNEGWYEDNIHNIYGKYGINCENPLKLANDFEKHHSVLEKYGAYTFYYFDSIKKYTLHIYVDGKSYEISDENPKITGIK